MLFFYLIVKFLFNPFQNRLLKALSLLAQFEAKPQLADKK